MSYILYINGHKIDLMKSSPIAQTKQVNDIGRLDNRQTNFTNKFTVPFTPNNIRRLGKISLVGNQSNIPYEKVTVDLFDLKTGDCIIYKGWGNIPGTNDKGYEIYVYDGNIDIYKAIENKTLGDLDISELKHEKTLEEVVSTFDNSKPYKYILADYNGEAMYDGNKINIDYLIPSVRAPWLLSKIEEFSGFKLNGSFKTNPDFINLYLTYPKGNQQSSEKDVIYDSETGLVPNSGLIYDKYTGFTVTEALNVEVIILQISSSIKIVPAVNGVQVPPSNIYLYPGDILSSYLISITGSEDDAGGRYFEQVLKYNSPISIDFSEELSGFTIKDFLDEIVWRFCLTLFKDKYSNVYNLKSISEITDRANVIDWSDKFRYKQGEKYVFASYAQNNIMRYKYNDENAKYNNGTLRVENKNLEDSKTIIESKIYSPELRSSKNLGFVTQVYKLWEKEPKDDGSVDYKPLADRFYFIKSVDTYFDNPVLIGSKYTTTSMLINYAPVETFKGLKFDEIIKNYYPDIKKILNKSLIITSKLSLKSKDINNVQFDVPYYFEQLGGYFLINKINGFVPKQKTSVELVRLNEIDLTIKLPDYSLDYSADYSH